MGWSRFFHRRRWDEERSRELDSYIEIEAAENRAKGMSREEALCAARRKLGNATLIREEIFRNNSLLLLETFFQDVRFALRLLVKDAGFTVTAVLTLALGIGTSTAVFSLVDALLLNPLPYPQSDRIMMPIRLPPRWLNFGYNEYPWGRGDFQYFTRESKAFASLGAFRSMVVNLSGSGDPIRLEGLRASVGFFPALGVSPLLGRTFTPEEDQPGHEHEVILSYELWRDRFGASRNILGRNISLNGYSYSIIGVMPADFAFPKSEEMPAIFSFPHRPQIWVPLALSHGPPMPRELVDLAVISRLRDGVTLEQAQADMDHLKEGLETQYPDIKGWFDSTVTPLTRQVVGSTARPLLLILGAVGIVLVVVCFNVAGLLLARSPARIREFNLRVALGAQRMRLVRQLLTESIVLATAGGILGIIVAEACVYLVKVFGPVDLPRLREAGLDWRVTIFALGVTLLTGLGFGLEPAIVAARQGLIQCLKAGGLRSVGSANPVIRKTLLVSEIALALVLVVAAGLLTQTLWHLLRVDAGFNPGRVLTFELSFPAAVYTDREHIVVAYQELLRRLRSLPEVDSAAITQTLPMGGVTESTGIVIAGRPVLNQKEHPYANYSVISSGYFRSVDTPVIQGRDFLDSDMLDTLPVAIINQTMARKYWPGQDPIGQQVGPPVIQPLATIVGIVADVKHLSLREESEPEMYVPFTQKVLPSMLMMGVVLHSKVEPNALIAAARKAIQSYDPSLPLSRVAPLATLVDDSVAAPRFSVIVLTFFGGLAVLLAAIGMYGVISYSVAQRTQEISIRMALGAQRNRVFSMIVGQGARLALLGIAAGLLLAIAVTRLMAGFLFGVHALDPLTFLAGGLLVVAVALSACYLPAHRATRVDPLVALRCE